MLTVLVKNNLRRASPSTMETMMEDKLEGTGLPTHCLVILDVSWVLALPLYLYVEPWSHFLEKRASSKLVWHARQESFSDSRTRRQGPWRLDPDATVPGV